MEGVLEHKKFKRMTEGEMNDMVNTLDIELSEKVKEQDRERKGMIHSAIEGYINSQPDCLREFLRYVQSDAYSGNSDGFILGWIGIRNPELLVDIPEARDEDYDVDDYLRSVVRMYNRMDKPPEEILELIRRRYA